MVSHRIFDKCTAAVRAHNIPVDPVLVVLVGLVLVLVPVCLVRRVSRGCKAF